MDCGDELVRTPDNRISLLMIALLRGMRSRECLVAVYSPANMYSELKVFKLMHSAYSFSVIVNRPICCGLTGTTVETTATPPKPMQQQTALFHYYDMYTRSSTALHHDTPNG